MRKRLSFACLIASSASAAFGQWANVPGTNDIQNTNIGSVGVGGAPWSAGAKFHSIANTAGLRAIIGQNTVTSGTAFGVAGQTQSPDGISVQGLNLATTGNAYGVVGRTESTSGIAIFGNAAATTGNGIGVWGRTLGPSGIGVLAVGDATTGYSGGLRADGKSSSGYAVLARALSASGTTYAMRSEVTSPNGYSVYALGGRNYFQGDVGIGTTSPVTPLDVYSASDAVAIQGEATSVGIVGYGGFGGVYGEGPTYGVRGAATSPGANGLEAIGGLGVTGNAGINGSTAIGGNLTVAGTKSFKIDHPLDPENKYLVHYCTEAPEPLNVYSGTVTLDSQGTAWVDLPEYFGAVNADPRYQLTAIGAPAPMLHIAHEIEDNRFMIGGGLPGMRVSWRIEGVRNDPYVRAHGAPVEVDKGGDRGKYLRPELYGAPAEKGVFHIEHAEHGAPAVSKASR